MPKSASARKKDKASTELLPSLRTDFGADFHGDVRADVYGEKPGPAEGTQLSRKHRSLRAMVVLAAVAAVAFVVVLPEISGSSSETALSTTAAPIARAESLQNPDLDAVNISLERSSTLDAMELQALTARIGTPADDPGGFEAAVSSAVQSALAPEPVETTPTTVWEEPPLPPESQWVDSGNGVAVPDILLRIRFCESTNNYNAANTGSSARGAYQFLVKSWDWYGHADVTGVTEAHLATPAQQDAAALRTLQAEGTGPWAESRRCWNDPNLDPRYATAKPPVPTETTTPPTTVPGDTTDTTEDPDTTTETTVPEDGGEETTVPETTVPETTVPETTVPETTVPDTTAGDTTVP